MKKYMMFALLSAVYIQASPLTQLEDLEMRVQEREAALPGLREQLKKAPAGSNDARQLRNKINQSEEFIATSRKEIAKREGSGTVRALPVFEEEPAVIYANIPTAPALPEAPAAKPGQANGSYLDDIRKGVPLKSTTPDRPQIPSEALFGGAGSPLDANDLEAVAPSAQPAGLLADIRKGVTLRPTGQAAVPTTQGVKRATPDLRDQLEQAMKRRRTSVEDDLDNDVDGGDWD